MERNFFAPQQKLVSKTRDGAKVIKHHDTARTPHQRVLAHPDIDQEIKDRLTELYGTLNPAQLRRDIAAAQDRLIALSAAKGHPDQTRPPARGVYPGILT